jgi:ribonuclease HI
LSAASSNEAELTIYVDGSCQDNQNVTSKTPAGWGAVIVTGDNQRGNGTGAVETEISGSVITDSSVDGFLGAEVGSNNTAELSAIAHALRWVLVQAGQSKIIIRGDSQYALEIAQNEVSSLQPLTGEWVRAHRGHRWNERADHLAFRAMQGEQPLPLEFWKPGQR